MSNLFDETNIDLETNEEEVLKELRTRFGDGNEFDVDKLATGKLESDRYIKNLERELAELRQANSKNQTMEEILSRIKESQPQPQTQAPPRQEATDGKPDVESVVRELLEKREREAALQTNQQKVAAALDAEWGADANRELNRRARELGMSLSELKEYADRSPNAFFRIVGIDPGKKREAPQVPSMRPSTGIPDKGPVGRDKAYYERLKATNPKEYFSHKTQQQYYKDRMKNPDLFR